MMLNFKTLYMKQRIGVWVVAILLCVFGLPNAEILAQQSAKEKIGLSKAIEMALANNPEVKRALLATEDSDELVKIAYSEIYPNISSSINYTRNIEIPVSFLPGEFFGGQPGTLVPVAFGTDNNWQGGFSVTQTLFRGETIIGLSSATIFRTVQNENYRAVSQQIVTRTRIAYYQVLVAKEQLRLQQAQINRLEQNLSENERRKDAGLVDEYAVLQLQVQLSNQRPLLIEAEYALLEAYRNLKFVIGVPYAYDFEVMGDLNEFDILGETSANDENSDLKRIDQMNPFTYQEEVLNEGVLADNRGDLRTIDAQLDLKDQEITAIKSRFLPSLSATYNLQWSSAEPGTPDFFENNVRFQTLGINFSLPLFEGFKRVADVQRAQISRKDLEEQFRAGILNAQNEVASASEDLNMAFETANARKKALEQAQEGYERAKLRFDNGLGSQIEVTEAEVQVRQAEVNYAVMVFNYLTAKAQFDLATGIVPFIDMEATR
jgi:outer membrane protein TolC